MEIYVYLEKL